MTRITEDLIRKRAEHNNCELSTLEEVSLHQFDIEKIEHIDKWCRQLKILYLQANLIPKIENVGRLKKLEYLNLALNNVSRIENLSGCESLHKLDLTINFIGELTSVESLKCNIDLRELYLTGNPCTKFEGYRSFTVAVLPQLKSLDGKEVERSERILAIQNIAAIRASIIEQQTEYLEEREVEKNEEDKRWSEKPVDQETDNRTDKKPGFDGRWYTDPTSHVETPPNTNNKISENIDDNINNKDAYIETNNTSVENEIENCNNDIGIESSPLDQPFKYTPESRVAMHKHMSKLRADKGATNNNKKYALTDENKSRPLERHGRRLNINEGNYKFRFREDLSDNSIILEVDVPRFMDTSLLTVDVQPTYVHFTIKGKILQLVLSWGEEVEPDKSSAQRSQITGQLVIRMPKVKSIIGNKNIPTYYPIGYDADTQKNIVTKNKTTREYLEVDPLAKKMPSLQIAKDKHSTTSSTKSKLQLLLDDSSITIKEGEINREIEQDQEEFIDDPDVPPLE